MPATRWTFVFTAGLLLAPQIGSAQDPASRDSILPFGGYVLLGGGVTDFTKGATRDRFDVGGAWDARLGVGSRSYLGGEVAYVGSALGGAGAGSDLTTNGVEAIVRVQYPHSTGRWLVEPFAFGGIGWSRLSLDAAAPGLKDGDDVGVVPFGAGLTVGYDRFLLDARFTYRTSFNEDLAVRAGEAPIDQDRWAVGASVGYAF